ncbi:hypothetical protein FC62_GL000834 [Amylolactobacillus amylotrophicus DSM 20534]|uniref:Uncharacterized protein n=3 Tax=Amylolactobacillus TaxID=2767876 RepID=A0A0R1YN61_9LACO|nr:MULTISPECIES: alkaline phosphatase family protein [Amylolactobacillus]APT18284.1 hypothetical protein LA20533_02885 [Amylolactobacillus amylophilus DSM 20533 = JCM 1125]KRK38064.1 hypothetical protein FC62_GL000834 [Amylolactobacillus amylotrophicus DSM 20534]KRM42324.1 hypothetical protein FD40_GL001111 [Amylolactobacillus amylophilus DSM 20533 = JCM 1125]GED80122.1 hypothetical protein LAM01_05950 [Amylolactobacillus amylophilus]
MQTASLVQKIQASLLNIFVGLIAVLAIAYNSLYPATPTAITFRGSRYLFVLEFAIILGISFILGSRHETLLSQVKNKQYYYRILLFFLTYSVFTFIIHLSLVSSALSLAKLSTAFNFVWKINNPTFILFWLALLSPLFTKWFLTLTKNKRWLLIGINLLLLLLGLVIIDRTNRLNLLYLVAIFGVLFSFSLGIIVRLPHLLKDLEAQLSLPLIAGILIVGSLNFEINTIWWNTGMVAATNLLGITNPSALLIIRILLTFILITTIEWIRQHRLTRPHLFAASIVIPSSYFIIQASNYSFRLSTMVTGPGSLWLSLINLTFLLAIYMIVVAIVKRVYLALGIYSLIVILVAYANMQKVLLRNEPITPLDLKNIVILPELISMINATYLVGVILGLVLLLGFIWLIQKRFNLQLHAKLPVRLGLIIVSVSYLVFWVNFLPTQTVSWNTTGTHVAKNPAMRAAHYSTLSMIVPIGHYRTNGTLVGFASMLKVTAMEQPHGYSKSKMEQLAYKYTKVAQSLNQTRKNKINDQTIIYILSESLANPARIPGVQLTSNPLPNITNYQANNHGGLFFSNGYGGGTANIEFEAITGLSMNNFSPSMSIPYSFLVPQLDFFPTIINSFDERIAIHPFTTQTYERNKAFKKLGFQRFYAQTAGTDPLKYSAKIGNNPYVSDAASYKNVLAILRQNNKNKIIQLSTMQNHVPYLSNYYDSKIKLDTNLSASSVASLETYTKGVNITDKETANFIQELNQLPQKVTVVLYGDHLPGIYNWQKNNEQQHAKYDNVLHQSDYFIYSNFQEKNVGKAVVSPNMLNPLLFAKTDAKVSPFYGLMTKIALKTPAAELGKYMADSGKYITQSKLTKAQRKILADYNMVMYDLTAGKKYLNGTNFYAIPH